MDLMAFYVLRTICTKLLILDVRNIDIVDKFDKRFQVCLKKVNFL